MNTRAIFYTSLGIALCAGAFYFFQSGTVYSSPVKESVVRADARIVPLPNVSATAWGVFDTETGEIVVGDATDVLHPIASITKLITASVVLGSDVQTEPFTIMQSDVSTEGRAGKLNVGDEVTLYSLLYPLLLESSNDAAAAIRRRISGGYLEEAERVVEKMGLIETHIADASGLSAQNVSTVEDLALLYIHISDTYPHILDITQLDTYVGEGVGYVNNNPGQNFPGFAGGKQGYIEASQFTFVGGFGTFGIVLLGSENLRADIEALYTYAQKKDETI
jgi:serine-type D-Ala-D-Ala carboxypeptidase (penicillin-binding protein 5/6)